MAPRFGLVGGKLGHSLSPAIHRLFFTLTGKTGEYDLLEVSQKELPVLFQKLAASYGGCNVTIPHKVAVLPFLQKVTGEAAALGAVNTVKFTDEGACGYNTDYFGFQRMLAHYELAVKGKRAAVLGSGGAARAAVKVLADGGIAELYLVSRQPEKIDPSFKTLAPQISFISYAALEKMTGDLLINCTPAGMYPAVEASPVQAGASAAFAASVDLVYNPAETLFMRQAKEAGKFSCNGLFMLAAQAVAAQEIWQGESYPDSLILKITEALTA